MTRIEAPSRLHFGLLHVPIEGETHLPNGLPIRQFGGVGLMIDSPGIVVRIEQSATWRVNGFCARRVLDFAQSLVGAFAAHAHCPYQITVEQCPTEHIGLGVGTALGLATAKAIAVEIGKPEWSALELAPLIGRGLRSAVGVYGFDLGGLIVEAGKLPQEQISPLIGRYAFPEEWRIVLIQPNIEAKWHGLRERQAFRDVLPSPTGELSQLLLTGILPGILVKDLAIVGESLHEYNAKAGEAFRLVQGGPYSHSIIADTIKELRDAGIRGVGQSSWGSTIFAVLGDADQGNHLARKFRPRFAQTYVTTASTGVKVQ